MDARAAAIIARFSSAEKWNRWSSPAGAEGTRVMANALYPTTRSLSP